MSHGRPAGHTELVYPLPATPELGLYDELLVRPDEWAVFAREGHPVGTLDAGRHTLSPQNIGFLGELIDSVGRSIRGEVYFVFRNTVVALSQQALGPIVDPLNGQRLTPYCSAEVALQVVNPERYVYAYYGLRGFQTQPDPTAWLRTIIAAALRQTLARVCEEQRRSLGDFVSFDESFGSALAADPELQSAGLQVTKLTRSQLTYSPEDQALLREAAAAKSAVNAASALLQCPHCHQPIAVSLQPVPAK